MNEVEYERTFLARYLPEEINSVIPSEIVDTMFPADAHHPQLRLRKNGNKYFMTKKAPVNDTDKSVQYEDTIILTINEYNALAVAPGKSLEKDRYKVEINGFLAEVDVFKGDLKGLVVIDFEFRTEEEKNTFVQPDVCLADVTQEDFIAGGLLCGKAYADIEAELARFNYKKL